MAHKYPRQKKSIVAINGIFDDFQSTTWSAARWFDTFTGVSVASSFVSAPGGAGGNALRLLGTIGNGLDPMVAQGGISPYPNKSKLYYISTNQPYKFKVKSEFRLYIAADRTDGSNELSHCAGFCLDGNVNWSDDHNEYRTVVYFSVANQKAGIVSGDEAAAANEVTSVAWSGSLSTWYDIRIEWEFDWYAFAEWTGAGGNQVIQYDVNVYVNNSLLISTSFDAKKWRDIAIITDEYHTTLGRCGPHINVEDQAALTGQTVDAYYKDVLVTVDFKVIDFEYNSSIIIKGTNTQCEAFLRVDSELLINEGDDLQIWERNTTSDDWTDSYRGIIRHVVRTRKNMVKVGAEGYVSLLIGEQGENLSYSTKTTGFIVDDMFTNPDTFLFDTSTYFDSTSTTYNRDYKNINRLDIVAEMLSLEEFIAYVDGGNSVHFQSLKSNSSPVYLKWTKSKIIDYELEDIFVRKPNFVRVVGSGVFAEREVLTTIYESSSRVTRIIQRHDLTVQSDVDDALDYYMTQYQEPVRALILILRANHAVKKGHVIRTLLPRLGIINAEFLVISVKNTMNQVMTLTLIEVKPELPLLLADLQARTENTELETLPTDETAATEKLHVEGTAKLLVSAYYLIKQSGSVVRSGQATVTDYCMEWITAILNGELDAAGLGTFPNTIAFGTGTTPPDFTDTSLETETASVASSNVPTIDKELAALTHFGVAYLDSSVAGAGTFTEIGLRRSSDLFLRAVIDSYSTTGFDIYFYIKVMPAPGPCMFSNDYLSIITHRMYTDLLIIKTDFERAMIVGTDTFTVPNIHINEETEQNGIVVICPKTSTDGTLTKTKIIQKNLIKYKFTYTFDYTNDRHDTADGDKQVAFISLTFTDFNKQSYVFMFYRNDLMLSELDGFDCKFIFWLKVVRGDLNPSPQFSFEEP